MVNNITINEDSSYALGLLWADGYIGFVNKGYNGKYIGIEVVSEDFIDFQESLHSLGKVKIYTRHRENRQHQTSAIITNSELCEWLYTNEFHKKSLISPCKILSCIDDQYKIDFMRGWIDGDGCFYVNEKNKTYQFVLAGTYEQDWTAFTDFLTSNNISFKIKKKIQIQNNKENKCSIVRITDRDSLIRLVSIIYQKPKHCLTRKLNKASSIPPRKNKKHNVN